MAMMNYNSSSAERYTLQISNESVEALLQEHDLSSANNFEVSLTPSLDLHQLSYLQSLDVEVKTENLQIDSCPLVFQEGEKIETFFTITPDLATGNFNFGDDQLSIKNQRPLIVNLSDFQTNNIVDALKFLNKILQNSSNLFIITRYLEVLLDCDTIVKKDLFEKLNIEREVTVSTKDLNVLLKYVNMATYTRLKIIEIVNNFVNPINPGKTFNKLIPPKLVAYTEGALTLEDEEEALKESMFLNTAKTRRKKTEILFSSIKAVNTTQFYDIDFRLSDPKALEAPTAAIKADLLSSLNSMGFLERDHNGSYSSTSLEYLKKIISNNITLLRIGKKLRELLSNEKKRLELKKQAKFFVRHFLSVTMDHSQSKCRFLIDRTKLVEKCKITVNLPPIVSYRLGSARDLITRKYALVKIGPISVDDYSNKTTTGKATKATETAETAETAKRARTAETAETAEMAETAKETDRTTKAVIIPKLSNNINHDSQRLSGCMRITAKLLCLATDFLAESSRQQEKEQFFFSHDDMVTFFKVPLKPKYLGPHFLAIESSQLPPQPFFKVHKARMQLNTFKIMLFDENGEPLLFPRDTLVKIALTFRPCLLSID